MHKKFFATSCASLLTMLIHTHVQACMFESETQALGDGTVRTYVTLDNAGNTTELGVILSDDALSNLPSHDQQYVLLLPPQAATTAITHIGLDWKTHGHMPPGIYGVPHFDVHAYIISPEEREAITATGANLELVYEMPMSDLIPANYILAPDSGEPGQGAHWIDPTSNEFQGEPHGFDHALIYGFYDGEMTFVEPMVSLEFLQSQESFEGAIAQPQRYTRPGHYPTRYSIMYNPATDEHIISLTGFATPATANP